MPWGDWQFWLVTAFALAGGWFVLRPLLPGRKDDCGACGTPPARPKRTNLTVGGTDDAAGRRRKDGEHAAPGPRGPGATS